MNEPLELADPRARSKARDVGRLSVGRTRGELEVARKRSSDCGSLNKSKGSGEGVRRVRSGDVDREWTMEADGRSGAAGPDESSTMELAAVEWTAAGVGGI